MDPDSENLVLDFHEHFPKDKLHAELLSLRDPWILADYISDFWREKEIDDFGTQLIYPCVFDGLDRRMQWPKSDRYLLWKIAQDKHVAEWELAPEYKLKVVPLRDID